MITKEFLLKILPPDTVNLYSKYLIDVLPKYSINTKKRIAYFLANVLHESTYFKRNEENLFYSSFDRIRKVFAGSRSKFLTPDLAKNPQKLANVVYGGDWGRINLGNTQVGDGWKFRGRGAMQITGRSLYNQASKSIYGDLRLIDNPDLLLTPEVSIEVAAWIFKIKGCNQLADSDNFNGCVRAINGGLTNINHRLEELRKIEKLLM